MRVLSHFIGQQARNEYVFSVQVDSTLLRNI